MNVRFLTARLNSLETLSEGFAGRNDVREAVTNLQLLLASEMVAVLNKKKDKREYVVDTCKKY